MYRMLGCGLVAFFVASGFDAAFAAEKPVKEPQTLQQSSSTPLVIEGSEGAPRIEEWVVQGLPSLSKNTGVSPAQLETNTLAWLLSAGILTGIPEAGLRVSVGGYLSQDEHGLESKP